MVDQKLVLKLLKNYIAGLYDLTRNQGDQGRETKRLYVVPGDELRFLEDGLRQRSQLNKLNETGQWSQYFYEVTMTDLLPLKQTVSSGI
jgi:hypothetical protein